MTNKEAIEILKVERDDHINHCPGITYVTRTEAINIAIKALEFAEKDIKSLSDAYSRGWQKGFDEAQYAFDGTGPLAEAEND